MPYEKQVFIDRVTDESGKVLVEGTTLKSEHLAHIEEGIASVTRKAEELEEQMEVAEELEEAMQKVNALGDNVTDLTRKTEELEREIADLKYVPIAITKISNNVGTVEKGVTVNEMTVSWTLNKEPVSQTLDGAAVEATVRSKTVDMTGKTSVSLVVTDEREGKANASTGYSSYNGVYYGVMEDGADINNNAILALTRKLQSGKSITFTVTAAAGQRIAFALPANYGAPNFNVGGFDGGFTKAMTIEFTNASGYTESYDVWLSDNTGLGSTTVKVS